MATRKNPETEQETREGTEPVKETDTAKLQAEIAALKAELDARKAPAARSAESDFDRVHRMEAECAANGTDPWATEIEVLVPHREKTEDPWYWISVNSQTVQIPANDRYQKMRLPFACVLVDTLAAQRRSIEYQDSLEVFDPETNPHK